MAEARDEAEEIGEINVVPLVDVMLVLLTIVLTTASFVVTGRIPVDLARASHVQALPAQPCVITLTAERALHVDDRPVPNGLDGLADALARVPGDRPVVVRADAALALGPFVELVDRVRTLGRREVSLEVRRP